QRRRYRRRARLPVQTYYHHNHLEKIGSATTRAHGRSSFLASTSCREMKRMMPNHGERGKSDGKPVALDVVPDPKPPVQSRTTTINATATDPTIWNGRRLIAPTSSKGLTGPRPASDRNAGSSRACRNAIVGT